MRSLVLAVATLVGVPAAGQEVQRVGGGDVAIYNLAGQVEVVRGSGPEVVVRITRGGRDASRLQVQTGDIGGRATLRVVYPDELIVYPELGRGSNMSTTVRADGTFSDGRRGGGERVRIRGSGNGVEAWADLVVEVPGGDRVSIYLAVGRVDADGVQGDLEIDTGSGPVTASDIVGRLSVDTGSGEVFVRGVSGDVSVDTGSGRIELSEVTGDRIEVDTGSGRVTGSSISASALRVDTGSGRIELDGVSAPDVVLDTGSGSVDVEILSSVRRLEVDTGSGSITIRVPPGIGATVELETASGGIDVDFPVEVRSVRRDSLRGTIGDGSGAIEVDTGSGSIRLLRTAN